MTMARGFPRLHPHPSLSRQRERGVLPHMNATKNMSRFLSPYGGIYATRPFGKGGIGVLAFMQQSPF